MREPSTQDLLKFLGRTAEAQTQYDAALTLDHTAAERLRRAAAWPRTDHEARLKDVEEALKLDPDNEAAQDALAYDEAVAGRADQALAHIDASIAREPENVPFRLTRAFVYSRAGKTELAVADIDWARAHIEQTASALNSVCYDQAMWNLSLDKALADCDKALGLSPRSSAILDSRAFVLLRLGRLDEALRAYALALKLAPRQADSLYGRGLAELQKGLVKEGRADLEAARRRQPRIDETFAQYGVTPPAAYASSNSATK